MTPPTAYFVLDASGAIASRACWSQREVRDARTWLAREKPEGGPYRVQAYDVRKKPGEVMAVIRLK